MSTGHTNELLLELHAGRFDASAAEFLAGLRLSEFLTTLRGEYPILFQERVIGQKREVGLARSIRFNLSPRRTVGSRFFSMHLQPVMRRCIFVSGFDDRIGEVTQIAGIRIRPCGNSLHSLVLKSGSGHKLDRTGDEWLLKPLEAKAVTLSEDFLAKGLEIRRARSAVGVTVSDKAYKSKRIMANRAYLLRTDQCPCLADDMQSSQVLCEAKYSIPVFWYMLFDRDAIVYSQEEGEYDDGVRTVKYPALSAPIDGALSLAESRWPAVEQAIGARYESLFKTFCAFVQAGSGRYAQCETRELWWMTEPDEEAFFNELTAPLSVFRVPLCAERTAGLPPQISKPWADLLGQKGSIERVRTARFEPWALCGVGSSNPAPWETM